MLISFTINLYLINCLYRQAVGKLRNNEMKHKYNDMNTEQFSGQGQVRPQLFFPLLDSDIFVHSRQQNPFLNQNAHHLYSLRCEYLTNLAVKIDNWTNGRNTADTQLMVNDICQLLNNNTRNATEYKYYLLSLQKEVGKTK